MPSKRSNYPRDVNLNGLAMICSTQLHDASVPSNLENQPSSGLKGQTLARFSDAQNQVETSSMFADIEIPANLAPMES